MLDQITHLFRLQTILEEGSLRRASEKLGITQPALSRSLAQLEAELGQPLMERHSRGMRATPFGEQVLSVSRRIERYWEIAEHELRTGRIDEKAVLRIGGGPVWRSGILSDILGKLQSDYPDLIIEFSSLVHGRALQDLREGALDVAFGSIFNHPEAGPRFSRLKLADMVSCVLAREDHPIFETAGPDGRIARENLRGRRWAVYSEVPAYGEFTRHRISEHTGERVKISFLCQNLLALLTIIQRTDCLCVLPAPVARAVANPRIIPVPVDISTSAEVGMILRTELLDWGPVRTLMEQCKSTFATPV